MCTVLLPPGDNPIAVSLYIYIRIYIYIYDERAADSRPVRILLFFGPLRALLLTNELIQGVTGGTDQTSGECSLC